MIRSYLLHCYKFQFRTLAKPYKRKGNDLSHSWTKVQHVYMRALNIDIWHFQLMKTIEKWESMMLSDTRSIKIRKHTIRMGYSLWLYSFIKRQVVKIGRQKAFHELWVRNNFGTFFFLCVATNHHFHHPLQLHTFSVRDSVRVNMLWAVYNIHDNNYGLECSISEVFANEHKKQTTTTTTTTHTHFWAIHRLAINVNACVHYVMVCLVWAAHTEKKLNYRTFCGWSWYCDAYNCHSLDVWNQWLI